jgi:hypothetical protein
MLTNTAFAKLVAWKICAGMSVVARILKAFAVIMVPDFSRQDVPLIAPVNFSFHKVR